MEKATANNFRPRRKKKHKLTKHAKQKQRKKKDARKKEEGRTKKRKEEIIKKKKKKEKTRKKKREKTKTEEGEGRQEGKEREMLTRVPFFSNRTHKTFWVFAFPARSTFILEPEAPSTYSCTNDVGIKLQDAEASPDSSGVYSNISM